MTTFKRVLASIGAGVALSAMAVAPAQAAYSTVIKFCRDFPAGTVSYSDHYAYCAQVYTTINSLTIRRGPTSASANIGSLRGGEVQEFDCWTYGQTVNTNNIWLMLYSPANGPRYVSDRFVYTGPNLRNILGSC